MKKVFSAVALATVFFSGGLYGVADSTSRERISALLELVSPTNGAVVAPTPGRWAAKVEIGKKPDLPDARLWYVWAGKIDAASGREKADGGIGGVKTPCRVPTLRPRSGTFCASRCTRVTTVADRAHPEMIETTRELARELYRQ